MRQRLLGKVVVVTGAGGGMGEAMVGRFCAEGAKVVAVDINGLQNSLAERFPESCIAVQADVSKEDDVKAMLAAALETYGGLDVLCNNAGIEGSVGPTADYDIDEFRRVWEINTLGPFMAMRYGIPLMLKRGGGSIINTASIAALVAMENMPAYCSSKAAMLQLAKSATMEYGSQGIRVNTICPGTIETPIIKKLPPEFIERLVLANPVGFMGVPADIASLALFLASDESKFITGTEIVIDGGFTAV